MSGTAPGQDSHAGHPREFDSTPLDAGHHGQAQNILDETELHGEELKDRIDGAVPKGPKKADPSSGGRVMVGERGDLHDLAAARQS